MKIIDQPNRVYLGTEYWDGNAPVPHYFTETHRRELRVSNGHYGYPDFPPDRSVGGPFTLWSTDTVCGATDNNLYWRGGSGNQRYLGSFAPNITQYSFPGVERNASAWGATAYSKMKPAQPLFNGLNSIYELKDVPEMLRMRFIPHGLKDLGDFHLGLQFGWLALLRDCRNLVQTQRKAQDRLAWLLQHNGKPVRRRVTLQDLTSDPTITNGSLYTAFTPGLVTQYYATQPVYQIKEYTTDKVWASARMRYWLPPGPRDINWTRRMLFRIFGIQFPSPSMIYNAIPWSWLVDWFSNAGDVVNNLDAGVADRLAADYFYVMREVTAHREMFVSGSFHHQTGGDFRTNAVSFTMNAQKSRLAGDPFGFATNQNSLSGMQLSILGALGLSKLL